VDQGHAETIARQDEMQHFHRLREQDAIMLIETEPHRVRVGQQALEIAALVGHDRHGALVDFGAGLGLPNKRET
jgi:hypothetical protein